MLYAFAFLYLSILDRTTGLGLSTFTANNATLRWLLVSLRSRFLRMEALEKESLQHPGRMSGMKSAWKML
jgi:hypothetical protein